MKVVIYNSIGCMGSHVISNLAWERMEEICAEKNVSMPSQYKIAECRHDPVFVQAVEELGEKAVACAGDVLKVIELGPSRRYKIITGEGGYEFVVTPEDTDWQVADKYPSKPSMLEMSLWLAMDDRLVVETNRSIGHTRPGVTVKLGNGNTVSAQWGDGNYCANQDRSGITVASDCENAEVAIWGPYKDEKDVWHGIQEWDDVIGGQTPTQVKQWVEWASKNEIVPRAKLPCWYALEKVLMAVQEEVSDEAGIKVTFGWDGVTRWGYHTGGNWLMGSDKSEEDYQHTVVVTVNRKTDPDDLAGTVRNELEEAGA